MYPGYNIQQALQDQCIRELLANTIPDAIEQPTRFSRFFTALRRKLTAPQTTVSQAEEPAIQPSMRERQWE